MKTTLKVNKKMSNIPCSHKSSILDKSSKNEILKKSFKIRILRWTSFLKIPLTFLYDEYIDWPKLSEKKNPVEYIVPPPTSEVGTTKNNIRYITKYIKLKKRNQLWPTICARWSLSAFENGERKFRRVNRRDTNIWKIVVIKIFESTLTLFIVRIER